jgi:hypothetical protein
LGGKHQSEDHAKAEPNRGFDKRDAKLLEMLAERHRTFFKKIVTFHWVRIPSLAEKSRL